MKHENPPGNKPTGNRTQVNKLNRVVTGALSPVILIYSNPDPDALASAWALREIIRCKAKTPIIGYTGEVGRLENQAMIENLRIPARQINSEDLASADLIALVDCQPEFFDPSELPRCDIVIDHHPKKSRRKYAFSDIRPSCLATSSILVDYLRCASIDISPKLATALYYGIQTDSNHLQRRPTPVDSAAMSFLEQKININLLHRLEFSSYSLERLDYFAIALVKLRHSKGILYSHLGSVPHSDICVQIADFLIRVKEAEWALVSGNVGRKLIVVFRCDGHHKHAGKTAEGAFGMIGSAGGHRTIGRAEVNEDALPEGAVVTQNDTIERFVLSSLSKVEKDFKALLDRVPDSF